jgi:hypothetical protein
VSSRSRNATLFFLGFFPAFPHARLGICIFLHETLTGSPTADPTLTRLSRMLKSTLDGQTRRTVPGISNQSQWELSRRTMGNMSRDGIPKVHCQFFPKLEPSANTRTLPQPEAVHNFVGLSNRRDPEMVLPVKTRNEINKYQNEMGLLSHSQ